MINRVRFTKEQWQVGRIAAGTVGLGMAYGVGDQRPPGRRQAINLLRSCLDEGINLFDTAPAYGDSEELVGEGLAGCDCYIATKVNIPVDEDGNPLRGSRLQTALSQSLGRSLKRLQRQTIDLLQIHNATAEFLARGEVAEWLDRQKAAGLIRVAGASVYGVDNALAALGCPVIGCLQVAVSVFDQRMVEGVLPRAAAGGVAVMIRSALLKGALTVRVTDLPDDLARLREQVLMVKDDWQCSWSELPVRALRYCLSVDRRAVVLVGINSRQELSDAVQAANECEWGEERLAEMKRWALTDEQLIDPRRWPA
ncbi:MAG: aldo/keto reductase [Negativicutes bacterium]|nr:aldo/keto reductase [Negativicutes bacterium]